MNDQTVQSGGVLTTTHAQAILKFLASTQIAGSDAPMFMECVKALRLIALPPEADPEK